MDIQRLGKLAKLMVNPKITLEMIDKSTGQLKQQSYFQKILTDIEKNCNGFVDSDTKNGGLYWDCDLEDGIYYGSICQCTNNPNEVYLYYNDEINGKLILDNNLPDELAIEYQNRRDKTDSEMFWIGYVKDAHILINFYPDGINKENTINELNTLLSNFKL